MKSATETINASQVGATDQLVNGKSVDDQTNEFSSSKQENRTFLSGKVKVLTRGFVSEQSIAASLIRHTFGVYNCFKKLINLYV